MSIWSFCDELDAPELGVCNDQQFWNRNYLELSNWFLGQGVDGIFGERVVFVPLAHRSLFLLRWEGNIGDLAHENLK